MTSEYQRGYSEAVADIKSIIDSTISRNNSPIGCWLTAEDELRNILEEIRKLHTFYHGTSDKNWEKIQQSGQLFDGHTTYLAIDRVEAECYGNVLLEVEYNPFEHPTMNNYCKDCWQFRVYEPIELNNVKRIK